MPGSSYPVAHQFSNGGYTWNISVDFSTGTVYTFNEPAPLVIPGPDVDALTLGFDQGDVIVSICDGTTLKRIIADFTYPYAIYEEVLNSSECGFLPPICSISWDIESVNPTDGNANGKITVIPVGSGTFEYSLDSVIWQTGNVFSSLLPGLYNVYIRNGSCVHSKLAVLTNEASGDPSTPSLIPFQDGSKLCFAFRLVIGGVVYNVSEPLKWDTVQIVGERDMDFHGYLYKYTDGNVDLGFDCDAGRDLIEAQYALYGNDAEVLFQYGYVYEGSLYLLFKGKLNFNTRKWYADRIECSVETEDFDNSFHSRLETKVSMKETKTFDQEDVIPPSPYELELHAKKILAKHLVDRQNINYTRTALSISSNYNYIIPDSTEATFQEISDTYSYALSDSTLNPVDVDLFNYDVQNDGTLELELELDLDVDFIMVSIGGNHTAKVYWVEKRYNSTTGVFTTTAEDITTTPRSSSGLTWSFNIQGTKSFNSPVFKGDKFFVFVEIHTTGSFGNMSAMNVVQNRFYINAQQLQQTPATKANTWFLDDVMRHCINVISNNRYAFRSSFIERKNANQLADGCGSKHALTNGFQIRKFEVNDRPLKIDLKKILKSLKAEYCIGLNYSNSNNTPVVRLERVDYFYQDKEIIAIPETKEYREEVARDLQFNEIEIGYKTYMDEGFNTLDEHCTKQEDLTPIKSNKLKLSQLSEFIRSGYAIEDIRREQFAETQSSSVTNDEETFAVTLRRTTDDSFVTEKDEAFETVNNIISPETSYNLRLSPKRMLYNWFIWLKGVFAYKQDSDKIKNTFVTQNNTLSTRFNTDEPCRVGDIDRATITENADEELSKLSSTANIYRPEWIYFKARINPAEVQMINLALSGKYSNQKNYGYVMVKKPDNNWVAGWVYKLGYNYHTEECEIKMLKKYSSPTEPDNTVCCNYLLANGCRIKANGIKLIA